MQIEDLPESAHLMNIYSYSVVGSVSPLRPCNLPKKKAAASMVYRGRFARKEAATKSILYLSGTTPSTKVVKQFLNSKILLNICVTCQHFYFLQNSFAWNGVPPGGHGVFLFGVFMASPPQNGGNVFDGLIFGSRASIPAEIIPWTDSTVNLAIESGPIIFL